MVPENEMDMYYGTAGESAGNNRAISREIDTLREIFRQLILS